jgi:hypothetical protein
MVSRAFLILLVALGLASCRSIMTETDRPDADTANRPAQTYDPQQSAGRSYMLEAGASAAEGVPDMERGRKINEQDCTKSIDLTAGNLKCR